MTEPQRGVGCDNVGQHGGFVGKRRISLFVFMLLFGLLALLNCVGKPRFSQLHRSDYVQLIAVGLCLGFGFGILLGHRKFLGE
jgi:hypothetical protein